MKGKDKRRFAANSAILPDGEKISLAVVEIAGKNVVSVFHLQTEISFTEWIGGCIELKNDRKGVVQAFKNGEILSTEYKKQN